MRRILTLGMFVMVIWGLNFSVIKVAEATYPPLFLAALRFALCCFPAIMFLPRPQVPVRYLLLYGLTFGVIQFSLLFSGIEAGLAPGLSSVALQVQVFFTILFGVLLLHDRINVSQATGILLGFVGIGVIGTVTNGQATIAGLLLVVGAGLAWGLANIIAKKAGAKDPFAFIVWSCTVPILPLLALSLIFEGYDKISDSLRHTTLTSVGSLLYLAYPTTLVGYAIWNSLLRRYKTQVVAPLTLLVPVFGLAFSALIFGEHLNLIQAAGIGLIIGGLLINQFGGRLYQRLSSHPSAAGEPAGSDDLAEKEAGQSRAGYTAT